MARMRAAERADMRDQAERAMVGQTPGQASGQALGWRKGEAAATSAWTPALAGLALAEAGKVLWVMSVAGCWPAGLPSASAWPEYRRRSAWGDYPGEASVRFPLPSATEIAEMDRRYAWVQAHVASPVRRRVLLARSMVHPFGDRPRVRWETLAQQLNRSPRTVEYWHAKGRADLAAGLQAAGEPVKIGLGSTD